MSAAITHIHQIISILHAHFFAIDDLRRISFFFCRWKIPSDLQLHTLAIANLIHLQSHNFFFYCFRTPFYARKPIDVDLNSTHFIAINIFCGFFFFFFSLGMLWPLHMQREFQRKMILHSQSDTTCFYSSTTPHTHTIRHQKYLLFFTSQRNGKKRARAQLTRFWVRVYVRSGEHTKQN